MIPIKEFDTSYQWYDIAGRRYGLSVQKVAAIVKKHGLKKRRIYGNMAVECEAFHKVMAQDAQAPGEEA